MRSQRAGRHCVWQKDTAESLRSSPVAASGLSPEGHRGCILEITRCADHRQAPTSAHPSTERKITIRPITSRLITSCMMPSLPFRPPRVFQRSDTRVKTQWPCHRKDFGSRPDLRGLEGKSVRNSWINAGFCDSDRELSSAGQRGSLVTGVTTVNRGWQRRIRSVSEGYSFSLRN